MLTPMFLDDEEQFERAKWMRCEKWVTLIALVALGLGRR